MTDQNSALVKVLAPALAESEVGRLATERLLVECVGAIGYYLGKTYTAAQASEAAEALARAVKPLAQTIDARGLLLAEIREAVKAADIYVSIEIGEYSARFTSKCPVGWVTRETIPLVPVARVPVEREAILLDDGRRVRVCAPPEHVGASAVLRCVLVSTPKPAEDF